MHPSLKALKYCCLGLGFAFVACNVFNPSGEGEGGESQGALMAEGEELFRQMDYLGAQQAFEKAIQKDSANSLAYYGYAKSVMRYWDVNAADLLTEVDAAQTGSSIPFIGADDWTLTRYLKSTSKARRALGKMTERDTLTRWFRYREDPTGRDARKDPLAAQRIAFIEDYWTKAEAGVPGYHYKKSQFPLSDLKLGYQKVIADFGFIELIYAVAHLRDLNGDDSIGKEDDLIKKLAFNTDGGGFKVENLASIQADLAADTVQREQMNNLIQNVASGLTSASSVIDLLAPAMGGQQGKDGQDTALDQKVTENMDSVINSLGTAVTFYQFGDSKDNDGDGCVDEEILDGKDNDGDSFTDEDARIVETDLIDNDHNGKQGFTDADEGADAATGILKFVSAGTFVKGSLYQDKAEKIKVQQDSLSAKIIAGKALTSGEQASLTSAKASIGGCWKNY